MKRLLSIFLMALLFLSTVGCRSNGYSGGYEPGTQSVSANNGVPDDLIRTFLKQNVVEPDCSDFSFQTGHSVSSQKQDGKDYILDKVDFVVTEEKASGQYLIDGYISFICDPDGNWNVNGWSSSVPKAVENGSASSQQTEPVSESEPDRVSPVKKNGQSVFSIDTLSMYDMVTFGRYPQSGTGTEAPIEWYVVKMDGNKAWLMSRYCIDSRPFHRSSKKQIAFKDSDLYQWLNNDFKFTAFSDEERMMLVSDVTLLNKSETMKLPISYRVAKGTEYAIEMKEFDKDNMFWWIGEASDKVEYEFDYDSWSYIERHYAYVMKGDGSETWEFPVSFHHKGVRPVIIIQF